MQGRGHEQDVKISLLSYLRFSPPPAKPNPAEGLWQQVGIRCGLNKCADQIQLRYYPTQFTKHQQVELVNKTFCSLSTWLVFIYAVTKMIYQVLHLLHWVSTKAFFASTKKLF